MSTNFHIIYNPVAGHGNSKKAWDKVVEFLDSINFQYQLHETKYENHASEITAELTSSKKIVTIVCMGGDGTLTEVVNGIKSFTNLTLSCIPCGSGNDFASSTKLPLDDPVAAIKYIIENKPRKINFMNVNGHRSINVVGFGLDTSVLKRYYKMKLFPPKMRYKIATIISTLFFKWYDSSFSVDNGPEQQIKTLMLTVGNGKAIGGGIKMCPLSEIDDNYLDFTYINKFPRIKTLWALSKVMKGKILELPFVKSVKCKKITFKIPNKTYQYDGVLITGDDTLNVEIAKEKINFIG